jgi:predicted alpha/beta superfamily hydrolase
VRRPVSRTDAPAFDFADLGPATLTRSASYRLSSRAIGQDFQLQVSWPQVRLAEGQRLPVVYVLDGNHAFAMAAQTARSLQAGPFPMPPTFVVGIGYHFARSADAGQWGLLRVRDFTPCSDPVFEEQYPGALVQPGGAEAFLDFIQHDVTPFLASRLPIDTDDQSLVGASLGGLFALYAMLRRPGAFQRVVAVSPAIYWGGRTLFDLEASLAARAQNLPVKLSLTAGSLEEAHEPRLGLVSNLYGLEARLRARAYPDLDMALQVFEGENHMSVFPGAVTRGLGHVFGGYPDMHDWSRALGR